MERPTTRVGAQTEPAALVHQGERDRLGRDASPAQPDSARQRIVLEVDDVRREAGTDSAKLLRVTLVLGEHLSLAGLQLSDRAGRAQPGQIRTTERRLRRHLN